MSTTRPPLSEDLRSRARRRRISLSKAGVTRSAKAIRIRHEGAERVFHAEISCSAT